MQTKNALADRSACPDCGFHPGLGEPNCTAQRDRLLARDYEEAALYWPFHRMAVDAYCLQHPSYVKSAKSLAAHLCGLCIAFEHANNPAALHGLQKWLSANPKIVHPGLPAFRGQATIGGLYRIHDPCAFGKAVESWAWTTWDAYHELQPSAREWLGNLKSVVIR